MWSSPIFIVSLTYILTIPNDLLKHNWGKLLSRYCKSLLRISFGKKNQERKNIFTYILVSDSDACQEVPPRRGEERTHLTDAASTPTMHAPEQ
jgi:hypothetical protein